MFFANLLAWLTWDPHPDAFVIPFLNHPVKVVWHSLSQALLADFGSLFPF